MHTGLGVNAVVMGLVMFFVFFGGSSQRITGMGFSLVAAPFLVIVLGPVSGVLIANLCGGTSSMMILSRVWADVEWRKVAVLLPAAFVGLGIGIGVAKATPIAWLEIIIGLMVAISLSISLLIRSRRHISGTVPLATTGVFSGLMSYTAGVGGPAVSVYAVLSNWPQTKFAATVQPYFAVTAFSAVLGKYLFIEGSVPTLQWWIWALIGGALLSGVAFGDWASRRVKPAQARTALIVVAYCGSLLTVCKGAIDLLGT
ncbi:sulfite exporter TauE/SafE family protein [Nakamurella antarctica]|uniref:Probable membrane transporter protein n=1 Tax=Nakamurella antarctica TaxID=1902245 RepID=A0A3G8ZU32_9ACTN|nr:sulfite exporter TauE/SafE family protein [Nakamurella antarctica]AZI57526.1 sulfite exporter TauE/SafE family protein [Nakamurella antarctica]